MNLLRGAFLLLVLLQPAFVLGAADQAVPVPIEVSSQSMEADQNSGRVHFVGSVVARQAPRTVYAENLTLYFAGEGEGRTIERIEASGAVRVVEGERVATAEKMTYLHGDDQMTLSGDAQVQQGENQISGEEIVLFLRENRSMVKSGKDGRVKAIFLPQGATK